VTVPRQLRLGLTGPAAYTREAFVKGPSNASALAVLEAWPAWPGGALALVGPEGVGKSHLASLWLARAGAVALDRDDPDLSLAAGRPVLIEDVDRGVADEPLFHLVNMAAHEGGGLLLTARTAPKTWTTTLPDLRSRLNALMVAEIDAPDDAVLTGALRNLFRERSIRPTAEVYQYLLPRMVRSIPYAREIVARLDEAAIAQDRPISRALVRQFLEDGSENLDLFE
jgi:chromosomal replication initiation ATPase DnaA